MILAGDIGGTKTHLAAFRVEDGKLVAVAEAKYASREHKGLDEIAIDFASKQPVKADRVCFGVAGPIQDGVCKTSNLPWIIDSQKLAHELEVDDVVLLNDLEATAHGIAVVPDNQIKTLAAGAADAHGNQAVIAAGTGLGEAGLFWDGKTHRPFACEGGHADFSPCNETEMALLHFLHRKYGHASWERVLSGPGLINIYDFLCEREPQLRTDNIDEEVQRNGAPAITNAAMSSLCPLCDRALDIFVTLYGAEAGNLALKMMATGGVYVGGGIAGAIMPEMLSRGFVKAFVDKGRMRPILEAIPIHVITTNRTALLGAAEYARTARSCPASPR